RRHAPPQGARPGARTAAAARPGRQGGPPPRRALRRRGAARRARPRPRRRPCRGLRRRAHRRARPRHRRPGDGRPARHRRRPRRGPGRGHPRPARRRPLHPHRRDPRRAAAARRGPGLQWRGGGGAMTALAWRLTRLGGRGALLSTGLTALAVAVATLLLQFAVASNFAFAERAERTEWRDPAAAETGSALFASAVDFYGGDEITRVDLASLDGDAPVPPGLEAFPAPGEVWVSPALAALLDGVPEEDFIDRYEGRIAGVLGREALAHDGEMLAVVGREADSPAM